MSRSSLRHSPAEPPVPAAEGSDRKRLLDAATGHVLGKCLRAERGVVVRMCVEEGVPASDVILAAHQRHLLCRAVEQQQHTPLRVPVAQLDRFVLLLVALQCKCATPHHTRTPRSDRYVSSQRGQHAFIHFFSSVAYSSALALTNDASAASRAISEREASSEPSSFCTRTASEGPRLGGNGGKSQAVRAMLRLQIRGTLRKKRSAPRRGQRP